MRSANEFTNKIMTDTKCALVLNVVIFEICRLLLFQKKQEKDEAHKSCAGDAKYFELGCFILGFLHRFRVLLWIGCTTDPVGQSKPVTYFKEDIKIVFFKMFSIKIILAIQFERKS